MSEIESTIEHQVVTQAKVAVETLGRLWGNLLGPYPEEHKRPETIALDEAIGRFALANINELEGIADLPLPTEVRETLDAYTQQMVKRKVAWAIFDQYNKQQSQEISALLEGKIITVTSIGRTGLVHSDRYTRTSGVGMPYSETGPFLSFEADGSELTIGEPDHCFTATIWHRGLNLETLVPEDISQLTEIKIIDQV